MKREKRRRERIMLETEGEKESKRCKSRKNNK